MNKMKILRALHDLNSATIDTDDHEDRVKFEKLILKNPIIGFRALEAWQSQYYISFKSRDHMNRFLIQPSWEKFQAAAYFLMLDRVIASVAMDGKTRSRIDECINKTLSNQEVDEITLFWVHHYCGTDNKQLKTRVS